MPIKKNKNSEIIGTEAESVDKKTPEEKVEAVTAKDVADVLNFTKEELEAIAQIKQGIDFSKKEELEKYGSDIPGDIDDMTKKVLESAPKISEELMTMASKIADLMGKLVSVGDDESQKNSIMSELENFMEESGLKVDGYISELEELWNSNKDLLKRYAIYVESGKGAIREEMDKLKKMKIFDKVKNRKGLREAQGTIDEFNGIVNKLQKSEFQAITNGAQMVAVTNMALGVKDKIMGLQGTFTELKRFAEQMETSIKESKKKS